MHRPWILGLAYLGAALSVGATPLAACDPVWLPVARPGGIGYFVALALADTVLETPAGSPREGGFGRSRGGQRVRVLRWPDSSAHQAREAVLVPWAYGPDCRPVEWTGGLDWIPAGTKGVVTGWLRPRERWLDDLPTFDVEMAWREPIWAAREPRWSSGNADGALMTPEEFLELYATLPTVNQLERTPTEAAERLRDWARRNSSLAARAPAPTVLSHVYRVAAERAGR